MTTAQTCSYQQIVTDLRKEGIASGYFIYGEETYLIDSLISQLCAHFLGEIEKEINYFVRYAPEASIDTILALSSGSGLFSTKKMVVLKDFQNLRQPNVPKLARYLQNPNRDVCLLLVARVDSLMKGKYQALREYLKFVNVSPLQEDELEQFIREEFERYEKKVTGEAIRTLLYFVGVKLHELKTEIVQVAHYHHDKQLIEADDVEQVVGVYANQNVFELTRRIAQKNLDDSLFILHNLLEKGESPQFLLYLLLRHLLMLLKIHGCYRSGIKNNRTIQQKLKIYPRQFGEYQKELPMWKTGELKKALALVRETDRMLKSSQTSPRTVLDLLILKLINIS